MKKPNPPIYDQPCGLLTVTRTMLQRDKRSLPELHRDTGMPFYWLRKLRAGTINSPSVNRVQFLYDQLIKTSKC